jgi:xanthine dehydrogenase accessory factor
MDLKLFEEMAQLSRKAAPFALATVIEHSGSSPRKAGAKMLMRNDGTILGSVGGGRVEAETIQAAMAAMTEGTPRILTFVLTEEHGFVCGGTMRVYVEPHGNAPQLVMIGAGHIGKATATLAKTCGFRVTIIDERTEYANREAIASADDLLCCPIIEAFTRLTLDDNSYVIVATPGHLHDFAAVREALRSKAGFIGLVGSRRKRQALLQTLTEEGLTAQDQARIVTPVGVEIGAETPEEIAVSIVGQLIQKRRGHELDRSRNSLGRRGFPAHGELQAAPSP